MNIHSQKTAKPQSVQMVLWGVDPSTDLGVGYSKQFRSEASSVVARASDELKVTAVLAGLEFYARKKPLTFVGRILGHGIPYVGLAFWAYDAYQFVDYLLND